MFEKKELLKYLADKNPLYIGISKLCCKKCRHAIKALNILFAEHNPDENIQYKTKILQEKTKSLNQDRSEGKIIIRSYKDEDEDIEKNIIEVFDYRQNKFINIQTLEKEHVDIVMKIIDHSTLDNDEKNLLLKRLGCMKNIIRYADASIRETHGLTAGESNWDCPKFMNKNLANSSVSYFYETTATDAKTRRQNAEAKAKYPRITQKTISEKFCELELEYDAFLETLSHEEDDDFAYKDQAGSQSPRSAPNTPESKMTTPTVSQQITLDNVETFIECNPGDTGKILEICYKLDIRQSFQEKLFSVEKELEELRKFESITKENFKYYMKTEFSHEFSFEGEIDSYIDFVVKSKKGLEEMSSCNFKDFESFIQDKYQELRGIYNRSP